MKKLLIILTLSSFAFAETTLQNYLKELDTKAKIQNPNFKSFSEQRGKKIFFSSHIGKRGKKISCTSCHTKNLKSVGENIFTGKKLKPLSPSVNPKRLTDLKKMKKWLRRNFKDVYKREGSSQEKGDVLMYILKN